MLKDKRGEFSFVWLFAIIAGTAFLVLAIYFAVQLGGAFKEGGDVQATKSLEILTNPLEAGFASTTTGKITFAKNTQINPSCYDEGLGYHLISTVSESEVLKNENPPRPTEVRINNKYIFAEQEFGKDFYVMSKPFTLGLDISDMLFISTRQYCFIEAPEDIQKEMIALNFNSIKIQGVNQTCSEDSINVCFGFYDLNNCDIFVEGTCTDNRYCESEFDTGYVEKDGERSYYLGNLLYGAIYSDTDDYECNVNRLLARSSEVFSIMRGKAEIMTSRGCNTLATEQLGIFSSTLRISDQGDLESIYVKSKQIEDLEEEGCDLW